LQLLAISARAESKSLCLAQTIASNGQLFVDSVVHPLAQQRMIVASQMK
jgi:hypothetical protein